MPLIRSSSLPNLSSRAPLSSKEVKKTLSLFNLTSIQNASEDLHRNLTPKLKNNLDQASNVVRFLNGASACAMLPTSTTSEQNCFAVYIDVLEKSNLTSSIKESAISSIKLFMTAQDNWNVIESYLLDKRYLISEKHSFFCKITGMYTHLSTTMNFLLYQLPIIFEESNFNMNLWKNDPQILCSKFDSNGACLEGMHSTFFSNLYEKKKGERTKIDINMNIKDNLMMFLTEFSSTLKKGENPTQFRIWLINQDEVIGGVTSEGGITQLDINTFIIYAIEELCILEEEKTAK